MEKPRWFWWAVTAIHLAATIYVVPDVARDLQPRTLYELKPVVVGIGS
jgi:hypothetical protein